ncbi:nitric oxide reductase activation protein NorD [Thiocystis violascens]|uniref:Nitric oxide reductase activation protein n=1 Tax=Thiocystis violascens (strain ATCC 17096 / DSM 198 / 6111) TaxID=765911 RepID=I3YGD0_THIV6|nr:VWA domain-containing protein [Thiocystis violascens]AFL76048.1 nitric oxide reductase activation protein [Thiocystis violascens DSM 198]
MPVPAPLSPDILAPLRQQLRCNFPQLDQVFPDCMTEARILLSETGIHDYLEGASLICRIGRGFEPVLVYLEEMPRVAADLGEETLALVSQTVWKLSRSPNGKAILPFLQSIAEASRRLASAELLTRYTAMILDFMERTTGSIHGFHTTIPSPSLPDLLERIPYLLSQLTCHGLRNWLDYGLRHYADHPDRQRDYFSLQSADSRAVLQRERHGVLFVDHERQLDLYLRALWRERQTFVPYSDAFDEPRKPLPYFDALGVRIPDCYDDRDGVAGIDRYRALLAHVAAHLRWSGSLVADNLSPFQRLAVETFEDCRVDSLALREYPGLRRILLALHPTPAEDACDPERESCIRHRLAMFSRAVLDPDHGYRDPNLLDFVARFHAELAEGPSSTQAIADLAIAYIARTRRQQDLSSNVYFTDTEVDYRDDNRHLWRYIEQGDEEEAFEERKPRQADEVETLPPRHYPEWDYQSKTYRPDWVSLYEGLHPSGDPAHIDALLDKHRMLAKRLKQILDLLKPQQYVRLRYQEEGCELDLDVAIRSLIDFRGGATPDPRINMSHRHDGRDIAVMLLLDLSQSLNQIPDGCSQSILELSQEAVALLGWAIDHLGDEFAIAGFSSNTRHEVRYQHIKGYGEGWDDQVKGRLAAMEAGYSTRMGAALRHAAHYLEARQAEKKLLLILTDGQPHDIDVDDERLLIEDTHKAVQELDQQGIYTYCINLDSHADEYVRDCFGNRFTVIDRVERLPEKLPQLFMALTK